MTAVLQDRFTIESLKQVERFIILGTEGGSYYTKERELTRINVRAVEAAIDLDGPAVVKLLVDISLAGRAPKQTATMFTLAACHVLGNPATRELARKAIPQVCRTGAMLEEFASFIETIGKDPGHKPGEPGHEWGMALRKAVSSWYNSQNVKELSYQVAKYQNRYGVTHADILKMAHPNPHHGSDYTTRDAMYKYIIGKSEDAAGDFLVAMQQAHKNFDGTSAAVKAQFVRDHKLSHEMIPTQWKQEPEVWNALLEGMPMHAMIRNLGNLAKAGLLASGKSLSGQRVIADLTNPDRLRKARVHPLNILVAYSIYAQGHGDKGDGVWIPSQDITDALDEAFYLSFSNLVPTNKRLLVAVDVSGSMAGGRVAGMSGVTPRIGAAALALVHLSIEPQVDIMGFSDELIPLEINSSQKIQDVSNYMDTIPFGGTLCELPMQYAMKNSKEYDAFIVYTDNETNSYYPPANALRAYRAQSGIDSKLIVVGMVANKHSIADPNDSGMIDVTGFDADAFSAISEFVKT